MESKHIKFIRLFKDVIPFKPLNIILEAFNCYCDDNIDRVEYLMGKIKGDQNPNPPNYEKQND